MRLIFAGLFIFVGMLVAVGILGEILPDDFPPWLLAMGVCGVGAGLTVFSLWFFNKPGALPSLEDKANDYIADLKDKGLLESSTYFAKRAFQVEEFEDEGSHYYLELDDSSILFLSGQYLYEYEPMEGNRKDPQPRRFPCSEFTLQKHREEGFVVGLECSGTVFEPELVAEPFDEQDFEADKIPEDGQIIHDRSYRELKEERLNKT